MFSDPSTYGLVQGGAYPDPSSRWRLRGGIVALSETTPMWGGCAVFANVPGGAPPSPSISLGPSIGKATSATGGAKAIAGFSVFDQAYNMVNSPTSTAPQAQPGQSANYYPLGSEARIVVACDPVLVDQQGQPIFAGGNLAWDFNDQKLVQASGADPITSGTYDPVTGHIVLTMAATPAVSVGSSVTLSALTGTGAFASLNGTWPVIAPPPTGTSINLQGPVGLAATTITGGSLTTGVALGTLPVPIQLLDVQATNCVNVSYDPVSGNTNWNFGGACAVIQI
jgi:hypothetical protein